MNKISKYLVFGGLILIIGIAGISKLRVKDDSKIVATEDEQIDEEIMDTNFNIVAGGDVMMSRHVGAKIQESGDNAMPFRKVSELFTSADIGFVNLESPFYDQGEMITEGMLFKTEPEFIEGLKVSGIDIVSLANNHTLNKGRDGLVYTLNYLKENGIEYSGAGFDYNDAHQEKIIDAKGVKIAFLSYTYSDGVAHETRTTSENPDAAFMDVEQMKKDVIRSKENNDVVVVSMHAGIEYKHYPNDQQQEFARAAVDSGAKLVLGHHPHVVQSVEQYSEGFIIYSMGNLVFDQMWSQETREGVIAKCEFVNKDLVSVEFIPTVIENFSQPRLADAEESAKILGDMGLTSSVVEIN